MERTDTDGDDMFNTVCGDLGLGNVRRSSLLLKYNSEDDVKREDLIPLYHLNAPDDLATSPSDVRFKIQDFIKKGLIGSVLSRSHTHKNNNSSDINGLDSPKSEEVFPTYADVPYGTSYRQQKKLYDQQMGHLRQQQSPMILLENSSLSKNSDKIGKDKQVILTAEELDEEIQHAMLEMDELKLELDACCKRLDAKYQAVAILKKQAEAANTDLQSSEKKFYENNKRLEKEVSKLQFELEWRESSFMDSQQTWAERFDRVCRDNSMLTTKLEERNEEMRRLTAHKAAIARERDELLALLDVSERMKYEQGKSMIAEEEYGSFTSTELAVLGACKCRGANPEPCGCAHAAANLRKEVVKLREEIKEINKRRQEAYLTVDAYRLAFEEQMAKARQMSQQLASISTLSSRSVKAKAAMKFLLKSLSSDDEEMFLPNTKANHCDEGTKTRKETSAMSLQELVQALTDVVHEKEEALVQQKLAAQVLANKMDEMERQLPQASNGSGCGLNCQKDSHPSTSRCNSVEDGSTETSRDKTCVTKIGGIVEGDNDDNNGIERLEMEKGSQEVNERISDDECCCSESVLSSDMKDKDSQVHDSRGSDGCGEDGGRKDDEHLGQLSSLSCDELPQNDKTHRYSHDANQNEEGHLHSKTPKISTVVWSPIRQSKEVPDDEDGDERESEETK